MRGDIYLLHELLTPLIPSYRKRALLIHHGYHNLTKEQKADLPIRPFIYDQLRSIRCNHHRESMVMWSGYRNKTNP